MARPQGRARGGGGTRRRSRRDAAIRRRRAVAVLALAALLAVGWAVLARGDDGAAKVDADATTSADGAGAAGSSDGASSSDAATTAAATAGPARVSKKVLAAVPKQLAVRHAAATTKKVALTFDDGPSEYTDAIADTLERYGAHGTFFVLGREVETHPDLVRRVLDAGHAIGNHSWGHPNLTGLSVDEREQQMKDTNLTLRRAVEGPLKVQLMRPPYGGTNAEVNQQMRALGLLPIMWSVDSSDYQAGSTSQDIARRVLDNVQDGAIILMHDGGGNRSATRDALPLILETLRVRGFEAVTVPELLNAAPPDGADDGFLESMGGGNGPGPTTTPA